MIDRSRRDAFCPLFPQQDEYLELREESQRRKDMVALFRTSPSKPHPLDSRICGVLDSLRVLLEDYTVARDSYVPLRTSDRSFMVADDDRQSSGEQAPEGSNAGADQCRSTRDGMYDMQQPQSCSLTQSGRSAKRRKRTPSHNGRSGVHSALACPERNTVTPSVSTDAMPETAAADFPTFYSEISNSVLSDPQVFAIFLSFSLSLSSRGVSEHVCVCTQTTPLAVSDGKDLRMSVLLCAAGVQAAPRLLLL